MDPNGDEGMRMRLVATFFSHFGALRFRRLCRERGVAVELMPVPRSLSSSCGTCARFERTPLAEGEPWPGEVELVAEELPSGTFATLWAAD